MLQLDFPVICSFSMTEAPRLSSPLSLTTKIYVMRLFHFHGLLYVARCMKILNVRAIITVVLVVCFPGPFIAKEHTVSLYCSEHGTRYATIILSIEKQSTTFSVSWCQEWLRPTFHTQKASQVCARFMISFESQLGQRCRYIILQMQNAVNAHFAASVSEMFLKAVPSLSCVFQDHCKGRELFLFATWYIRVCRDHFID